MFLRPLGWIYARVALNEWAALGLFFAFLSAAFGVFGQWGPIAPARLRPALFACVVAGLISLSVCGIRYRADVLRESAVVVVDEVDVRSGPGSEYTLAFQIHEGLQVYVSQMRGEWRQIHLGGELVGWVEAAELEAL
jgi:uncharacterized protein YgiM (DUF1202 family)